MVTEVMSKSTQAALLAASIAAAVITSEVSPRTAWLAAMASCRAGPAARPRRGQGPHYPNLAAVLAAPAGRTAAPTSSDLPSNGSSISPAWAYISQARHEHIHACHPDPAQQPPRTPGAEPTDMGDKPQGSTEGCRDRLPGCELERFGMGPAVVLGQHLSEGAGPVRDGAVADLAAGDRKPGDGHREAAGR
jgi:hypothetical protein